MRFCEELACPEAWRYRRQASSAQEKFVLDAVLDRRRSKETFDATVAPGNQYRFPFFAQRAAYRWPQQRTERVSDFNALLTAQGYFRTIGYIWDLAGLCLRYILNS